MVVKVEWWRDGKRRCGTCKDYLDPALFGNSKGKPGDGLTFRCKACERNNALKRQYGITVDQYDSMLDAQGGVCVICQEPPTTKRLAVDHDHACCPMEEHKTVTCGKCVRQLLCENCNRAIGLLQDNAARIRAAADYIDKWSD